MGDPFELAGQKKALVGTVFVPWPQIVFVPIYVDGTRWRSPVFSDPWTLPEWPGDMQTPYVGDPPPGMWRIT